MKVKICGIRNVEEARKVCDLYADALGILVGFESDIAPNNLSEDVAREIVGDVQDRVETFLLTNKNDVETNYRYISRIRSSHVQLLGDMAPEEIVRLKREMPAIGIVKAIFVTDYGAIEIAKRYAECVAVDALLLDSRIGRKTGGTGMIHDWTLSRRIVEGTSKHVWLAGGLRTSNLANAIQQVRPYGVDVETGVQNPDGSKNYGEIKRFIDIAHSYL